MNDLLEKFKLIESLNSKKVEIKKSEQKTSKKLHLDSLSEERLEEEIVYWKPEQECWDERLKLELTRQLENIFKDKEVRIYVEPLNSSSYKMIKSSIERLIELKDLSGFAATESSDVNVIVSTGEGFALLDITYFIELKLYTKNHEKKYRSSCRAFKDYSQRPGILRQKIKLQGREVELFGLRFRLEEKAAKKIELRDSVSNNQG